MGGGDPPPPFGTDGLLLLDVTVGFRLTPRREILGFQLVERLLQFGAPIAGLIERLEPRLRRDGGQLVGAGIILVGQDMDGAAHFLDPLVEAAVHVFSPELFQKIRAVILGHIVDDGLEVVGQAVVAFLIHDHVKGGSGDVQQRDVLDFLTVAPGNQRIEIHDDTVDDAALSPTDLQYAKFADEFEKRYVAQGGDENRSIEETLDLGWELLSILPKAELKRIKPEFIEKYLPKKEG